MDDDEFWVCGWSFERSIKGLLQLLWFGKGSRSNGCSHEYPNGNASRVSNRMDRLIGVLLIGKICRISTEFQIFLLDIFLSFFMLDTIKSVPFVI